MQFLQWFFTSSLIDVLVTGVNAVRVSSLTGGMESLYITALNSVTCDGNTILVTPPVPWSLASAIFVFVLLLSSIGLVCCLLLCGFVVAYRHHPIIRSASPIFLLLSIVGVALLFVSGYVLVASPSTTSCGLLSWLVNAGLIFTFGPLFVKTWRIYRIFGRKKLSVISISNKKLLVLCIGIFALEMVLMSVWQGVGNLQPIVNDVATSRVVSLSIDLSTTRFSVDQYVQCGVPSGAPRAIFAVIVVEKAMLIVFGALMAFTTRKVSSTFNESSGIALAIYNVCFTVGVVGPIVLVISAAGDVLILLLAFALLWIAYFTPSILLLPKVMHILNHTDSNGQANTSVMASSSSSSGYKFMSLAVLSTLPVLQGYEAALQKHLAQLQQRIAQVKGSGVEFGRSPVNPAINLKSKVANSHSRSYRAWATSSLTNSKTNSVEERAMFQLSTRSPENRSSSLVSPTVTTVAMTAPIGVSGQ